MFDFLFDPDTLAGAMATAALFAAGAWLLARKLGWHRRGHRGGRARPRSDARRSDHREGHRAGARPRGRASGWRGARNRDGDRPTGNAAAPAPPDLSDPNVQVRAVIAAEFRPRRVMNKGEYACYAEVRRVLREVRPNHHVFPQIPLGAILGTEDDTAFRSIAAKRLDLLVVDAGGRSVAAVEVHGGGHFQGDAMQRDRVKKEALRRAGIPLIEVYDDDDRGKLAREVAALVAPAAGPGPAEPSAGTGKPDPRPAGPRPAGPRPAGPLPAGALPADTRRPAPNAPSTPAAAPGAAASRPGSGGRPAGGAEPAARPRPAAPAARIGGADRV
jgi:hypothetical protein